MTITDQIEAIVRLIRPDAKRVKVEMEGEEYWMDVDDRCYHFICGSDDDVLDFRTNDSDAHAHTVDSRPADYDQIVFTIPSNFGAK